MEKLTASANRRAQVVIDELTIKRDREVFRSDAWSVYDAALILALLAVCQAEDA